MQNSITFASQIANSDSFYSDSDNEQLGAGNDESDAGSTSGAGEEMPAAGAPLQGKEVAAVAAAPAAAVDKAKAPLLQSKSGFDFAAAPASSAMQPFLDFMAMAMRNNAFNPASLSLNPPGIKSKTLKLAFVGTLEDLESGLAFARLVPEVKDIGKYLGGDVIPVTEIAILDYDWTGVPVTSAIKAPDHFNAAQSNHISIAGPVLFEAQKFSKATFAQPLVVHVGVESDFKKRVAKDFPGVNENNVALRIKESTKEGFVLVPYNTLAAVGVNEEIEHQKEAALAAGKVYTGPEMKKINDLNAFEVPKALAMVAMNCLIQSFVKTNDSFNVSEKLYFEFARSALSPETVQKMKSANAKLWTDPREITQSLKAGSSIDSVTKATFCGSITVSVKYNGADEKK
jgi:hypothetical protein